MVHTKPETKHFQVLEKDKWYEIGLEYTKYNTTEWKRQNWHDPSGEYNAAAATYITQCSVGGISRIEAHVISFMQFTVCTLGVTLFCGQQRKHWIRCWKTEARKCYCDVFVNVFRLVHSTSQSLSHSCSPSVWEDEMTPWHYSVVVYSVSVCIVPLRRIVWRQTAGWRRFRQWFPSWWSADTDVSGGFHSMRWPGPTGLQPTHKHTQTQHEYIPNWNHTNDRTRYLTTVYVLTDGVLRWKVNSVCVEKLQEGSVDGVRELADLYDLLLILRPLGAKHGPEMLTPTWNKRPFSRLGFFC